MKKKLKCGLFLILTLITGFFVLQNSQLLECGSESLKGVRYLLVARSSRIKRGDIVAIKGHQVPYVSQTHFAKRVLGLPGDLLFQSNTTLRIVTHDNTALNLQSMSLPLLNATQEGKPLTPLGTYAVPQGYVFVAGDHPRSFDSRYEEFGLVPISRIWGRSVLTW